MPSLTLKTIAGKHAALDTPHGNDYAANLAALMQRIEAAR